MPIPAPPPDPKLVASTVVALQDPSATYDANTEGFTLRGTEYALILQRGSAADRAELSHGEESEVALLENPRTCLTQGTWDIAHGGAYDARTNVFTYQYVKYKLRLRDDAGTLRAEAVEV